MSNSLSETIIDRIQEVTRKQLTVENKTELFVSTVEEIGEYARAIAVESGSKSNVILDESSRMEAIDVILCAFSLYFAEGGTPESLEIDLDKKLTKWENIITKLVKQRKDEYELMMDIIGIEP